MDAATLRLELFVDNVERSVAFYRDVLGFNELIPASDSTYRPMQLGRVRVALQDIRTLAPEHPLARPGLRGLGAELVLEVADIQASYELARAGGQDVGALVQQPWGLTDFRVTDPDGYYWRVTGISENP